MCASPWLAVLGGSFISFLITNAIGSSEMLALQKDRKRLKCNETKYTHSSCHLICHLVTDYTTSQAGERRRAEEGKESPREVFYFVFFFLCKEILSLTSRRPLYGFTGGGETTSEVLEVDYQKHPAVRHTFTFIPVHQQHKQKYDATNACMTAPKHSWSSMDTQKVSANN